MTPTIVFTIGSVVVIVFAVRSIWRELRRDVRPFSKGFTDEA